MSDREPIIELESVTKKFSSRVTAVAKLSLQVNNREIYGLLGPNGSGKTTTIKMILGLLRPTSGTIRVLGAEPTSLVTKYRLGYQPEDSYFYPFLNSYELLHFYGQLYGIPRRDRKKRIDHLLELVGLPPKDARRKIREYSKGMGRRIGLAQALMNDPQLLILDEPTAGMDPIGSREFKDLLHRLKEEGKTIVLSSHLLADVEDVCDHLVILYRGEVVTEGAVSDLLSSESVSEVQIQGDREELRRQLEPVFQEMGINMLQIKSQRESLESIFLRLIAQRQDESRKKEENVG